MTNGAFFKGLKTRFCFIKIESANFFQCFAWSKSGRLSSIMCLYGNNYHKNSGKRQYYYRAGTLLAVIRSKFPRIRLFLTKESWPAFRKPRKIGLTYLRIGLIYDPHEIGIPFIDHDHETFARRDVMRIHEIPRFTAGNRVSP